MAAKAKPHAERATSGKSYSGQHRGLRRHVTATFDQFEAMDAKAAEQGLSWSQWILALGLKALGGRK